MSKFWEYGNTAGKRLRRTREVARAPGMNRNIEIKAGEGFKKSIVSKVEKGSSKMKNKECLGFHNLKPIGDVYLSRFSGKWCGGLTSGSHK